MLKSWWRRSNLSIIVIIVLPLIWIGGDARKNKISAAAVYSKRGVTHSLLSAQGRLPLLNAQTVLKDALNWRTLGTRTGGRFVFTGGWQVTGAEDMLVYDFGRYVESGSVELQVRNFQPNWQTTFYRHHFLSLFRTPWGNHHPLENQETVWDLHAGSYYSNGVKLLSWTYDHAETSSVIFDDWKRKKTYRLKLAWHDKELQYFRNGILQAVHTHSAPMQMRYLFIGRDFTVGADMITNFKNNQYPAIIGPIYSKLIVKENILHAEELPPQIKSIAASESFANAARLTWATNEPAVCYVEYGITTDLGMKTPVLGLPAQTFSTTLAELAPNQTYYYRIVALDEAGNSTKSPEQIFSTLAEGHYLFKPVADTYVEPSGLYGTTRDRGNYGWMNLLGGAGRECYLRFNVAGVDGEVAQTVLRLHGRQSGNGGGTLHALNASWDEHNTTWLNKPVVNGPAFGVIENVQAGQWHEVMVPARLIRNGWFEVALLGSGTELVSFDSRESTNSQPELMVTTTATRVTEQLSERVTSF